MRFCRACGYRMGEGVEEYTDTVLLNKGGRARPAAAAAPPSAKPDPFQAGAWGAMSQGAGLQGGGVATPDLATNNLAGETKRHRRKKRKMHWIVWVIFALIMASVVTGGISIPFIVRQGFRDGAAKVMPQSRVGVNAFRSADGGAAFDYVTPPGGPADKAGLLGGDVVVTMDGKSVKNESDARSILRATPVGKTIEVVCIRDGQSKTTQLTTISGEEMDRLTAAFENRPEGKGYIGEGTDIDRVIVPGQNIYGVRLNEISKNRPADIAGLKDGDIVIEFDGLPMRTRRELEQRIVRALPYSTVKFIVMRNGERVEVPVKIGIDD